MNELKDRLDKFRALAEEVRVLRRHAARLKDAERELEAEGRAVVRLLDAGDLLARGNAGWEGRVLTFLAELTKP